MKKTMDSKRVVPIKEALESVRTRARAKQAARSKTVAPVALVRMFEEAMQTLTALDTRKTQATERQAVALERCAVAFERLAALAVEVERRNGGVGNG